MSSSSLIVFATNTGCNHSLKGIIGSCGSEKLIVISIYNNQSRFKGKSYSHMKYIQLPAAAAAHKS